MSGRGLVGAGGIALVLASCDVPPEPLAERTFIISSLVYGSAAGGAGLDLDGLDTLVADPASERCSERHADTTSPSDPSERGIDDGYLSVECTNFPCPRPERVLNDFIVSGEWVLALRFPALPAASVGEGSETDVVVTLAHREGCVPGAPAACPLVLEGERAAVDQPLVLDGLSFAATASLDGSRVTVRIPSIEIPLGVYREYLAARTIDGFTVSFDITAPQQAVDAGGTMHIDEIVSGALEEEPGFDEAELRALMEPFLDIDTTAPCQALSMGFAAEVTRVTDVSP